MTRVIPLCNGFVDPACPINWDHPLNYGLVADWTVTPNPGWRGGLALRDLVRGGKNPNDGTRTNGPTWISGGRPGGFGALRGNGTNTRVVIGTATALQLTSAFSVSGWLRTTNTGTKVLVGFYNPAAGSGFGLAIGVNAAGKPDFYDGVGWRGCSSTINSGTWRHLAAVYTGAAVSFYIDAALVNSPAASTVTAYSGSKSLLANADGSNFFWADDADAIAFHNRALTAQDVQAFYLETKAGNPTRWNWADTGRRVWAVSAAPVIIQPYEFVQSLPVDTIVRYPY